MATVTTPVPPPVKNDWLSNTLDNPRLSPPSPGGPRKSAPTQQVINAKLASHENRQNYLYHYSNYKKKTNANP